MRRLAIVAVLALTFSISVGTVAASAAGNAGYGCPPSFQGPIDLATFLALPRTAAGIDAGFTTTEQATAFFNSIDHNGTGHAGNGLVCYADINGSFQANPNANHTYQYNVSDDNSSKP